MRVIDGTGAAAREDQTVIVDHGKIAAVGPAASTPAPAGAQVMDLAGHTVIPGLVGMHEHLFYPGGGGVPMYPEMAYSFPRLYLASGVTTARTAGSMEPYTDLNIKSTDRQRPHARPEALHHRSVPGGQGRLHAADA